MHYPRASITRIPELTILSLIVTWASIAIAQTEQVLHSFGSSGDGYLTTAGLVSDASGNLYGTTAYGPNTGCGGQGCGSIFKLTPNGDGTWNESLIHTFSGADGGNPIAPVVFDSSGNLYGVTSAYGSSKWGTVFELIPGSGGTWTEATLYSFTGGADGAAPVGGVVPDNNGHVYGTTLSGGLFNNGVVFSVDTQVRRSADLHHQLAESVLYSFQGSTDDDGSSPRGGLIRDASGNLYGTTFDGGTYIFGTVFEIAGSLETQVYSFTFPTGTWPESGLLRDSSGNLYGTTSRGGGQTCWGDYGCGVIYELTPSGGSWSQSVLYLFSGSSKGDGSEPIAGLVADSNGNLYGTTFQGGTGNCDGFGCGTVFKLAPNGQGQWTETILYSFQGGRDGSNPGGALVMDSTGNLYGTTYLGGAEGKGVVFEITP